MILQRSHGNFETSRIAFSTKNALFSGLTFMSFITENFPFHQCPRVTRTPIFIFVRIVYLTTNGLSNTLLMFVRFII